MAAAIRRPPSFREGNRHETRRGRLTPSARGPKKLSTRMLPMLSGVADCKDADAVANCKTGPRNYRIAAVLTMRRSSVIPMLICTYVHGRRTALHCSVCVNLADKLIRFPAAIWDTAL